MLHNKKFMKHGSFLCIIKSCNFAGTNIIFDMIRNRFLLFLFLTLAASTCFGKNQKESSNITSRQFTNPVIWADAPDPDVIRVGDYFYMVTTTMHLMPGAPIMRSKDLVNWETVNYVFDKLTDSPKYDMKEGTVYGRGQCLHH